MRSNLPKALRVMELLHANPAVTDFVGTAAMYDVDVVELATKYFENVKNELAPTATQGGE